MSLVDFFSPVNVQEINPKSDFLNSQLGSVLKVYDQEFPDLEGIDLAIIGVADDRKAIRNKGCAKAADAFRKKFYYLHQGEYKANMVDLGNIRAGHSVSDTYAALKIVVAELVKENVLPIIIGGGQDLTYAQYMAYEQLEQRVDLVVVDPAFDLDEDEGSKTETTSQSY